MAKILIGNIKGPKGDQGIQGKQGIQGIPGPVGPTGTVDENTPITFTEPISRSDIISGESISTLFGKIQKWFSDLSSGAAGTLLDGPLSQNRALITNGDGNIEASSSITKTELECLGGISSNIQDQLNNLNSDIATTLQNYSFETDGHNAINIIFKESAGYIPTLVVFGKTILIMNIATNSFDETIKLENGITKNILMDNGEVSSIRTIAETLSSGKQYRVKFGTTITKNIPVSIIVLRKGYKVSGHVCNTE